MTHRIIREPNGDTWDVWQVDPLVWNHSPLASDPRGHGADSTPTSLPMYLDPALANGWLCFESRTERRRLAPIPRGWDRMNDAELRALCAWATVVPRNYGGVVRPQRLEPEPGNDETPLQG